MTRMLEQARSAGEGPRPQAFVDCCADTAPVGDEKVGLRPAGVPERHREP